MGSLAYKVIDPRDSCIWRSLCLAIATDRLPVASAALRAVWRK